MFSLSCEDYLPSRVKSDEGYQRQDAKTPRLCEGNNVYPFLRDAGTVAKVQNFEM